MEKETASRKDIQFSTEKLIIMPKPPYEILSLKT
jgi:hypothetical protein